MNIVLVENYNQAQCKLSNEGVDVAIYPHMPNSAFAFVAQFADEQTMQQAKDEFGNLASLRTGDHPCLFIAGQSWQEIEATLERIGEEF